MWGVRPAAVEEHAVEGVGLGGGEDAPPVVGMDLRLPRREEARAHRCADSAEREHGSETSSVGDLRRGDYWHRCHCIDDAWDERECRDGSPHMSAGFPPCAQNDVGARGSRGSSFLRSANGDENNCAEPRAPRR